MILVSVLCTEHIDVSDGFWGLTKNSVFKLWYENNVELYKPVDGPKVPNGFTITVSTLALDDLYIILGACGTFCYCDLIQTYRNVGHTLNLLSKELFLHFDEVQELMVSYSFGI